MTACPLPPAGWICTRGAGHRGPCAAIPTMGSHPIAGEAPPPQPPAIRRTNEPPIGTLEVWRWRVQAATMSERARIRGIVSAQLNLASTNGKHEVALALRVVLEDITDPLPCQHPDTETVLGAFKPKPSALQRLGILFGLR